MVFTLAFSLVWYTLPTGRDQHGFLPSHLHCQMLSPIWVLPYAYISQYQIPTLVFSLLSCLFNGLFSLQVECLFYKSRKFVYFCSLLKCARHRVDNKYLCPTMNEFPALPQCWEMAIGRLLSIFNEFSARLFIILSTLASVTNNNWNVNTFAYLSHTGFINLGVSNYLMKNRYLDKCFQISG